MPKGKPVGQYFCGQRDPEGEEADRGEMALEGLLAETHDLDARCRCFQQSVVNKFSDLALGQAGFFSSSVSTVSVGGPDGPCPLPLPLAR